MKIVEFIPTQAPRNIATGIGQARSAFGTFGSNQAPKPRQSDKFEPFKSTSVRGNGPETAKLQKFLASRGFNVAVDGTWGPNTQNAVKAFQQFNGLNPDGIVGPNTIKKINDIMGVKGATVDTKLKPVANAVANADSKEIEKVIGAGRGFTDVQTTDGEVLRRQGVRNWRNNNPGNLEYGKFSKDRGAVGSDGRFAVFPNIKAGSKAKSDLVFGPSYVNLSITDAINRYAPPSENDTPRYIKHIVQATGANPNTVLKDLNQTQRNAMLNAINKEEGFKPGKVYALGPSTSGAAGSGIA